MPDRDDQAGWAPSDTRYADQPVSLRSRLVGAGGVIGIAAASGAVALLSWTMFQTHRLPPPATLAAFDMTPPVAAPEPPREEPPVPEPEQPRPQPPRPRPVEVSPVTPAIRLSDARPARAAPPPPPPPPAPAIAAVSQPAAPLSAALPPAPVASNAAPDWQGQVLAALNRVRRYPREAVVRRQQGVPFIRFTIDRTGHVLSVSLERSSGFRLLDREALNLPRRAQLLPEPPETVTGASIELVVPVEFFLQ